MTLTDLMHQMHAATDAVFFVREQIGVQRELIADDKRNGHDTAAAVEKLATLEQSHQSLLAHLCSMQMMLALMG